MKLYEQCWQNLKNIKSFGFQLDTVPRDFYVELVEQYSPKTFLDVGCGTGLTYKVLLESNSDTLYAGLDITPKFIKALERQYPELNWYLGRAQYLPFEDNSFDMVTCRALLEHLEDPEPAIREMARVAKDTVVIVWHMCPSRKPKARFLEKQQVYNNTYGLLHIMNIIEDVNLTMAKVFKVQDSKPRRHRAHTVWVLEKNE